jgi:hypothetical protein
VKEERSGCRRLERAAWARAALAISFLSICFVLLSFFVAVSLCDASHESSSGVIAPPTDSRARASAKRARGGVTRDRAAASATPLPVAAAAAAAAWRSQELPAPPSSFSHTHTHPRSPNNHLSLSPRREQQTKQNNSSSNRRSKRQAQSPPPPPPLSPKRHDGPQGAHSRGRVRYSPAPAHAHVPQAARAVRQQGEDRRCPAGARADKKKLERERGSWAAILPPALFPPAARSQPAPFTPTHQTDRHSP